MLDFLVLGNVPGTTINISFESIVLFVAVSLSTATLYGVKRHLAISGTVDMNNSSVI